MDQLSYLKKSDSDSQDGKRKYRRISLLKRNLLLEKIFFENKKIKNVLILFILLFLTFTSFSGGQRARDKLLVSENNFTPLQKKSEKKYGYDRRLIKTLSG